MIRYFKLYLVSLAAFFAIDMVWLGLAARSFYQQNLGFLMAPSPNWFVAILFYLLFIAGLLFFYNRSRVEGQFDQYNPSQSSFVRHGHLCHLRLDQPRHPERLARTAQHCGYALGNGLERLGKLY
jgi:hypothetical protein